MCVCLTVLVLLTSNRVVFYASWSSPFDYLNEEMQLWNNKDENSAQRSDIDGRLSEDWKVRRWRRVFVCITAWNKAQMHALVGEDLSVDAEPSPVSVVSPYQSLGLYGSGAIAISSFILLSISSLVYLCFFLSLVSFSFYLFFFFFFFRLFLSCFVFIYLLALFSLSLATLNANRFVLNLLFSILIPIPIGIPVPVVWFSV